MPVCDELTGLRAARGEVGAVHDVVEPAFEQLEERLTRLSRVARRLAEIVLELRLEHAVVAAHLLFLAQLAAVLRNLLTARLPLRLLTGCRAAALDRALFRKTAIAFEEQLDLFAGFARRRFAAAQAADGPCISRHLLLYPKPGAASAGGSRCA